MEKKPIKPGQHGIIDYAFSTIQVAAPSLLGLNKKTRNTYCALGAGFLAVNAISDTPVGLRRIISFKDHQKADAAFLASLSLLTAYKPIRKHKRSLVFHLGFLALAVTNYILTDYDARPE